MSGFMRKTALVVGAVALIAATAGAAAVALAPAMAGTAGVAGVSAATLTAIGTYGGLASGVLSAISVATAPKASNQGSATTFQTNPQSGLPYAIGRTRMSGLRTFAATNTRPGYTKFNDLLWFGALLSIGGQIGGIEKFTIDNEIVTFDASGNAVGAYHDYQGQKIHLGGAPMASGLALSLGGGAAPGWTSQHKLSGITHAMWCLRYNKQGEMYGAGAPEPAWIGKWVRVYDPRLDSTYPGGSGTCRALNESTYVWSDNPALHALTWALGRVQNGKRTCGIGAPIANIRVAEFVECANVCEANSWTAGGVEWTTDSKWDTLKRMLQAGGARPTQTGAMIGCLVSMPRTAIATIESWHLLDSLSIAATKSRRDRFNSVIPRYVDEDSDWSMISGTVVSVPEYVTADGGARTKEIDYPLVQVFSGQVAMQPGQLAAYDIVNSREAGPINFTTGPEWIGLKTGDVVLLNVPEEGLINQPVLITRRAPDPSTGKVSFSAETETYSKHAYALGQSTTPPAPFSLTAPDLKPPAPAASSWAAVGSVTGEGLPAIVVTGDAEMPSADAVVIDYRRSGVDEWTRAVIVSANDPVRHVISPLESAAAYDVRVGYRVGEIDGDFVILYAVTGEGKLSGIEDGATNGAVPGYNIYFPPIPGIPPIPMPPGLLRNDLLSLRRDGMLEYQPYPDNADIKIALGQVAVPDIAGQLNLLPDGTLQFETGDGAITILGRISLPDIGAASDTSRRTLEIALDQISAAVARVVSEASDTRATFRDAGFYVDAASGQVRISAIDQTRDRVSTAELRINAAEASILLRASTSYVDGRFAQALLDPSQFPIYEGIDLRVSDVELRLEAAEASIGLKATVIDLNLLGGRVSTAEQTIDAHTGQISQKVDSVDFDMLDARVVSAEQVIEAIGDTASITQSLVAVRALPNAAASAQENALRALLAGDSATRYQVAALASARTELTAKINDDLSAEARSRTALAVRVGAAEASALAETQIRASETQAITLQVARLSSQFDDSRATFTAQIATLASETEALAARSDVLEVGIGENAARIAAEEAARIEENGAISASVRETISAARGLNGRVDVVLDIVTADLLRGDAQSRALQGAIAAAREEITTKVNEDVEAVVSRVTVLLARMDEAQAALVLEQIARVTQGEAIVRQILLLSSVVGEANASFTDEIGTLARDALATTLRIERMESAIGDNAAAIEDEASTRADAVGRIEAATRETVAAVRHVDGSAAAAAEEALNALLAGDKAQRDASAAIAAAREEVTVKINGDVDVVAQRVSQMLVRMGLAEASIASVELLRATAELAIVSRLNQMIASIGENRAAIEREEIARTDEDSAQAARIDTIVSRIGEQGTPGSIEARIQDAATTYVDDFEALAGRTQTVESRIGAEGSPGSIEARIEQAAITYAGPLEAQAEKVDAMDARLGAPGAADSVEAKIEEASKVYVEPLRAQAEEIDAVKARLGVEGQPGSIEAAIETASKAYVTDVQAQAERTDTIVARIGAEGDPDSIEAKIEDTREVLADVEGKLTSRVRIAATAGDTVYMELVADQHQGSRIVFGGDVFGDGIFTARHFVANALIVPAYVWMNGPVDGPGWDGGDTGPGGVGGGTGGGGGAGGGEIP
ncbi:hypothetical protein [Sphingobium sp. YG1]|uniref:hypothetical protein n=1 Tax=Sphingobium sp. YG1 TaxID=2082188 RepID=UPI000DBB6930|nr:hypothetical protein [Sphingobium sp. YG1]BBD01831.1 hypothetical protein YGS_C1P3086 [Sphingobium sp. YG1]